MADIEPPSPRAVLKDTLTALALIFAFAVVELVKHAVFSEPPITLAIALTAFELTTAVSALVGVVRALHTLFREAADVLSFIFPEKGTIAKLLQLLERPIFSAPTVEGETALLRAKKIGITSGVSVFAALLLLYLLALIGRSPAWLFWPIFSIGVGLPVIIGLVLAALEAHAAATAESGTAFMFIFVALAGPFVLILAFVMLVGRFFVPEAFSVILNFFLLMSH